MLQNIKILFDDHDTKGFNLSWWRSQLSIVSQEAVLFNMSYRENIRLGDVDATDLEVEEAAKAGKLCSFPNYLIKINKVS